ncbi:SufD family Fe-S cluster assembly protein [Mycoplasmatota bacterium]|nr:SufD family Fe-S cluster assembly protein [Mycoplasmatota bacterium]
MSEEVMREDLKMHFDYDDDQIIELRHKIIEDIAHKSYPKIGKIKLENFHFDQLNVKYIKEEKVSVLPDEIKLKIDEEENTLVLKDGNIIFSNLDDEFKKVKIVSYYDAVNNNDEEALRIFKENFIKVDDDKLKRLNSAYQNSALLIHIPKNVVVNEALKLHIIGQYSDLVHHTTIISEASSEFTIVEKIHNFNSIKVNYVSEVRVDENAKLNYIGIDRLTEDTVAFIDRSGLVKDDGSLIYALGQLNDGNTVSNNVIKLIGKNAYCESRNVLFTDKESIHAITVNVEHLSPYSVGTITNHGIVKDNGVLHVDGIGKIHQGMNNSNSQQQTSIITLSDSAKVNANPYLLIDEYDVQAGHGAGIGKVDEEQLYYLMSRGLSKKEAEKLIILGFLYPIIEMISSDKIKTNFIQTIEKKLSI